ncbi:MAG TPA: SRPBCC family protein [Solirubrobacteraceae bacterium]|nr:SRPBCC family protein [Solirubrobacteraceae bacterium]
MYGAFDTIENRPALRFERRLSHPVEVVWRAITESDELGHWFPSRVEVDELHPGAAMTFRFESMPLKDAPMTLSGRVTEFEPPRLFAFDWGPPSHEDHLRFELEPAGDDACTLRLTVLLDQREKAARDGAGWHVCLDRLETGLAGRGEASPGEDWRGLYEEYQRRGVPAGAPIPGE